jgi:signal transduction histidine kinase/CheY-like chemotaxis protein
MNESIVIGLIQNIALLLAFAMLYENFWLRNEKPRQLPGKIFTGLILGIIGTVLMYTPWTFMPGLVFDTRTVMLSISGVFFGFLPTAIAMVITSIMRYVMGGDGTAMGIATILSSGSIGILWGHFLYNRFQKNKAAGYLLLGLIVHLVMLGCTVLLPYERIVPTINTILLPVFLIYTPGTILLGLLMSAQLRNFRNRIEKDELYKNEHKLSHDLLLNQKELNRQVEKYALLNKEYQKQNVELQIAKDKAEESDRLKSAFLANLSHEIRTPMNAIMGFTSLLKENRLTGEKRDDYIDIVRKSGDYLLSIINDIVEISHIESGQVKIKESEFDPAALFDEIFGVIRVSLPEDKALKLILEKPSSDSETRICSDDVKLRQIVVNLLNNAVKYTERGEIRFGYSFPENGQFAVFVRDTGMGIESENLPLIFDRFRQLHDNGGKLQSGSGLGLAITKAYTELLGGKIDVQSEPGKGSLFTVTISVKQVKEYSQASEEKGKSPAQINGNHLILVAEDEEANWLYLEQVLSLQKRNVIRAANGREAVDLCRVKPVDLVLMDIKMPVMNGFEALEEIRKMKPDLPVIAQTAYALPNDVERLKKSFDDFITKPIDRNLLAEKIASVFNE